jgi:hypothetical protein
MGIWRRFWSRFDGDTTLPPGGRLGCGVTAWDRADAITMVR